MNTDVLQCIIHITVRTKLSQVDQLPELRTYNGFHNPHFALRIGNPADFHRLTQVDHRFCMSLP